MKKWLLVFGALVFFLSASVSMAFMVGLDEGVGIKIEPEDTLIWLPGTANRLVPVPVAKQIAVEADYVATEKELERIKKLTDERIKEAQQLDIAGKARQIIEQSGKYKDNNFEISLSKQRGFGGVIVTLIIVYRGKEVFRCLDYENPPFINDIRVFRRGEWLSEFEALFQNFEKRRIQSQIIDLKSRYGLEENIILWMK